MMKRVTVRVITLLIFLVLVFLTACRIQDAAPADSDTAATATASLETVETSAPSSTPTTTITPTVPLATLQATQTPADTPPTFLCPGANQSEEAWQCRESAAGGTRQCRTVNEDREQRCFEDLEHPFALPLENNWTISLNQTNDPDVARVTGTIVKAYDLVVYDDEGLDSAWNRVSIFFADGRELADWLTDRQRISPSLFPATAENALIHGRPAAIWINDCSPQFYRDIGAVIHNGERIIWWQHYAYNEAGIVGLRQMLDAIRFTDAPAAPAEIPDEIWREALQGCW
jgi:hypothetical protein